MTTMATMTAATPVSGFLSPLRLEYLDGRRWRLLQAFAYHVGGYPSPTDDVIVAPVDFVTDFASIPRVLHVIYAPTGTWGKAAVIHDWLYAEGVRSRAECDRIFREGMAALGVPRLRRWLFYASVRMGGWQAWGDHRARARHATTAD